MQRPVPVILLMPVNRLQLRGTGAQQATEEGAVDSEFIS